MQKNSTYQFQNLKMVQQFWTVVLMFQEVLKLVNSTPKYALGGLAEVGISIPGDLSENFAIPSVKIKTNFPSISTLGAQKAGWSVSVGDFFALGSGPARALALKPAETYKEIGYKDDADIAILTLEADKLPDERCCRFYCIRLWCFC